jgi:hypothetical protein
MGVKMIGVTRIEKKGTSYWYARVDGKRVYCGKGTQGKEIAVAALVGDIEAQTITTENGINSL